MLISFQTSHNIFFTINDVKCTYQYVQNYINPQNTMATSQHQNKVSTDVQARAWFANLPYSAVFYRYGYCSSGFSFSMYFIFLPEPCFISCSWILRQVWQSYQKIKIKKIGCHKPHFHIWASTFETCSTYTCKTFKNLLKVFVRF